VPHFGSSDHLVFLEGAVGVPAVALINWDDPYIHSSDDDLFQIDQTQLRRNNFLIGAMAYFLANADAGDVPLLLAETYAQGQRRLANDMQVALRILRESAGEADHGWKRASVVVEQGQQREARALLSARPFAAGNGDALRAIDEMETGFSAGRGAAAQLAAVYRQLYRKEPPARVSLTPEEQAASKRIPANVAPLEQYFENRQKVRGAAGGRLHGLMRAEVYNFVDGRRSYFDIYKAVYAEAAAAGEWYYGTVALEDVVRLLDAAVEAKALTLR
jgi:hypothetical protein